MATSKEYAYYLKGNKVAIVEKASSVSSGTEILNDDGSSTGTFRRAYGDLEWKSSTSDVANGLELEYTYIPIYNNFAQPNINVNKFYINGWTVIGGYLTFLRSERGLNVTNWTSPPYSAVTSGSAGGSNDYILVRDSARWSGIHKIQTAGTEGQLVTYTRVNETLPYFEDRDIDFNTDEEIYDGGSSQVRLANHFSTGDYIWTSGVDDITARNVNNGLFRVSDTTQAIAYSDSKIVVDNKYSTLKPASSTSGLEDESIDAAGFLSSVADSTINIYKAYRDYAYILTDITVIQDESFEIDLPNYLCKAIVYYLKGKQLEDMLEVEASEYFMAKFRKQVEKNASNKVSTHRNMQGFWRMR